MKRGFTLIEVLVAMVVLATISAGLLATTWRLVGIARGYVDQTVADSYCHDVIYAVTASTNKFGLSWKKTITWPITTNGLPRIESVDIFNRQKIVYPLWRNQDVNHYPQCTVSYPTETNVTVTVKWNWSDAEGKFLGERTATGACQ